jgi:hypothetical protein
LLIKTIGMDFQDNTKVTPENAWTQIALLWWYKNFFQILHFLVNDSIQFEHWMKIHSELISHHIWANHPSRPRHMPESLKAKLTRKRPAGKARPADLYIVFVQ